MNGWLLFFTFLSVLSFPTEVSGSGRGGLALAVTVIVARASVTLALLAGALRTGGYL